MSNLIGPSVEVQFQSLWKMAWYKNHRTITFGDWRYSKKLRFDNTKDSWVIGSFWQITFFNFYLVIQKDEKLSDHDPRIEGFAKGGLL